MKRLLPLTHLYLRRIIDRVAMYIYMPLFATHGKNILFDPWGDYSFRNISIGNDVTLGTKPILLAAESKIVIGNKVMFGPEVCIVAGNHNISEVGSFMFDVHKKIPEDDQDVIIEDDVWIGSRVLILTGVTIGRGAVVGAGAVVSRSIPPYAIAVGNPVRVVKFRWDVETILLHEKSIYPEKERFTRERLQKDQEILYQICQN
ncbi:transferase hexapeptide (six repeat-containing protein) [Syntrophus gentianae]|uniref:Transferase hexapeptide (Six repeat-containing protein) n=1 Tax=Syntrophus gentianae TaxID=43775 RepID=A0A1H7Y900_9BACT|nr:acyltransferase [Syntrophus gentianae]SEM42610.1 transferase hexapeptide (six repeat-containing protein) [Syntrophus gentianae]